VSPSPARVLWLIKGLGPGGAERLLVTQAPYVDRERFAVEACYLLPWKDHLVPELERAGVPTRCLGVRRAWDPTWIGRLRRLVPEGRFDVVHAHLPYAAIGARMAVRRMGESRPRLVYTEHNTWPRYRPATRRLNARTFPLNDAVIAVSDRVASSMRLGPDGPPVTVIPNGVDSEGLGAAARTREDARRDLGVPAEGLVVGTVGGITAKKGHAVLVRAARAVVDAHPDARFVFVGLPIDPDPVRAEIDRAGLGDRVVLAGYREEAARLMRAFDVYCLPSRFEGMPVSLLEAMALGIPAVATAVGGVPEVVADGEDVLLVPPDDPVALAATLISLLGDPARRRAVGEAAARTAERFSLREMVHRTEAVYESVLGARR